VIQDASIFWQHFDFWSVAVLSCLLLSIAWWNRVFFREYALPDSPLTWCLLSLLVVAGLSLRLFVIPHTHHVFDDEFWHMDLTVTMMRDHRFSLRVHYFDTAESQYVIPQWMPLFHFLVSVVYLAVGVGEGVVFYFNAVTGGLSVVVFFALGKALFGRDSAGLLLAGMLCFYPLHLKFSGGGNIEILSLMMMTATVLGLAFHARDRAFGSMAFAVVASTLAVLTRIENAILAVPVFIVAGRYLLLRADSGFRVPYMLSLAVLGCLIAIQVAVSFDSYSGWRMRMHETAGMSALEFILANPLNPPVLPALSVVGLVISLGRRSWLVILMAALWLLYMVVYTVVHRLDVDLADFHRYHVNTCLFQLTLAAVALWYMLERMGRWGRIVFFLSVVAFVAGVWSSADSVFRQYHPAMAAEAAWVREHSAAIPVDATVCTETPGVLRSAAGIQAVWPQPFVDLGPDHGTHLYFYQTLVRKSDPAVDWRGRLARDYMFQPVETGNVAGDSVGFYRLTPMLSTTSSGPAPTPQ